MILETKFLFTVNDKKGLSQSHINIIQEEINGLKIRYPNIVIEKVADCYTNDTMIYESLKQENIHNIIEPNFETSIEGKRYDSDNSLATYFANDRTILFNQVVIRRNIGKTVRSYEEADFIKGIVWHEWGHALGFQYSLYENEEMVNLFEGTAPVFIRCAVSDDRASDDIHEMIAAGFEKSELCANWPFTIQREIRAIIDNIINQKNPMSEEDKNKVELHQFVNENLGFDLFKVES